MGCHISPKKALLRCTVRHYLRYEVVGGCQISMKKPFVTLEWPLHNLWLLQGNTSSFLTGVLPSPRESRSESWPGSVPSTTHSRCHSGSQQQPWHAGTRSYLNPPRRPPCLACFSGRRTRRPAFPLAATTSYRYVLSVLVIKGNFHMR